MYVKRLKLVVVREGIEDDLRGEARPRPRDLATSRPRTFDFKCYIVHLILINYYRYTNVGPRAAGRGLCPFLIRI